MRRETEAERAAWTARVEGIPAAKANKYGARRTNGYASAREAAVAADFAMLAAAGHITEFREQVPFVLVPGQGKIRPITYIADFVYRDQCGKQHVCDVKGYAKNQVYRLKKRAMQLIHGIEIEEL